MQSNSKNLSEKSENSSQSASLQKAKLEAFAEHLATLKSQWDIIAGDSSTLYAMHNDQLYFFDERGLFLIKPRQQEDGYYADEEQSAERIPLGKRTKGGRKIREGNAKGKEAPIKGSEVKDQKVKKGGDSQMPVKKTAKVTKVKMKPKAKC